MALNYEIIHGLDFTQDEIEVTLKRGGLLSLELEFSKICNLRCIYCYASAGKRLENELTIPEIKNSIDQAAELGVRKIILLGGGEPLMHEGLSTVVQYIYDKGLQQVLFTNGTLLTHELSGFLFKHGVSIVVKHNSTMPDVQDELAGIEGAYERIKEGFKTLLDAGYPDGKCQLGIQTIICQQNIKEIPDMWHWARERGIIPYFEIITYQGRAKGHPELLVPMEEIERVFKELRYIDEKRFSYRWNPHPTIASFTCKRHLYSCLVNSQGYVQPCTGIDIFVGNIREKSLKEILERSNTIKSLRNIYNNIEGACADCQYTFECYGCRGNAYQMTGNYLASDPSCWLNKRRLSRSNSEENKA